MQLAVVKPRLRAPVDEVINLDEIPDAHRRMELGTMVGKVVVRIWRPINE